MLAQQRRRRRWRSGRPGRCGTPRPRPARSGAASVTVAPRPASTCRAGASAWLHLRLDRQAEVRAPGDPDAAADPGRVARGSAPGRSPRAAAGRAPAAPAGRVRPGRPAAARCRRRCAPSARTRRAGRRRRRAASPGTRPGDGRSPTTLQKLAGLRSDPPRSLPSARQISRAASAAAAPPLLPPALRLRSYGLRVAPKTGVDGVRARAELGRVGLAQADRAAPAPSAARPARRRSGTCVGEQRRAVRGPDPGGVGKVLVRHRQAVQQARAARRGPSPRPRRRPCPAPTRTCG